MRLDVLSLQLEGFYSTPVMVMCVAKAFRLIAALHSVSILRAHTLQAKTPQSHPFSCSGISC